MHSLTAAGTESDNLCDVEVNLCYSNPCGGNGTCLQREGGYTCQCHAGYTGEFIASSRVYSVRVATRVSATLATPVSS